MSNLCDISNTNVFQKEYNLRVSSDFNMIANKINIIYNY
jgi:hypothetical protein